MDNVALNIINEIVETETFVIDSDSKAEWALNKIREEQAEFRRMEMVCYEMIRQYQEKIKSAQETYEKKTSYLRNQLEQYFETITPKATKTQATYQLPSGKLKKKFGTPEFIRDEVELIMYLKSVDTYKVFIKTKESVDWSGFKSCLSINGEYAVETINGEIVPGVKVEMKPDKFEVEV